VLLQQTVSHLLVRKPFCLKDICRIGLRVLALVMTIRLARSLLSAGEVNVAALNVRSNQLDAKLVPNINPLRSLRQQAFHLRL